MFGKKAGISRSEIHGDVIMGDKIGVDEGKMREAILEGFSSLHQNQEIRLLISDLRKISSDLLYAQTPPYILRLFPDADENIHQAIASIDWENRRLVKVQKESSPSAILRFIDLAATEQRRHLITGPGGSGKTYSLWHLARKLFESNSYIPIYLSLSDFHSTNEVMEFLEKMIPTGRLSDLISYSPIIFFLDGWSQFPNIQSGETEAEQRKLLALLGNTRIFSAARYAAPFDEQFTHWELEGLSEKAVQSALTLGLQNKPLNVPMQMKELLRLPLILILYLLMGGQRTSKGALLGAFQEYLTNSDSEDLLVIMGRAAARITLFQKGIQSANFKKEVSRLSKQMDVKGSNIQIEKLGTLGNRSDIIQPVHDLYWEWLLGVGIMNDWEDLAIPSTQSISTRNGIKLALESGEELGIHDLKIIIDLDITYAALFIPYIVAKNIEEKKYKNEIVARINLLMNGSSGVDRYRGMKAALISEHPELFPKVLETLSEMVEEGYYFNEMEFLFHPAILLENKPLISHYFNKGKGRYYLLSAIQKSGDSEWVEWLKEQFFEGNLTRGEAVGTALVCTSVVPFWIEEELPILIEGKESYYLKSAAKRGENLSLARWVGSNYHRFVNPTNSSFYHLNQVLIGCGDNELFLKLFDQFDTFDDTVKELLLYAFIDKDVAWIKRLQEKFLVTGNIQVYHLLFEHVLTDISDERAREWTKSANKKVQAHGWKTLAKKHQLKIVPELILHLPETFHDVHYVPTLKALKEIDDLPESLIDELWKRIRGTIQPMLLDDMLVVLANIHLYGVLSIVSELKRAPRLLPNYHLSKFLRHFKEWEVKNGLQLRANSPLGDVTFAEYLVLDRLIHGIENMTFLEDAVKIVDSVVVYNYMSEQLIMGNSKIYQVFHHLRVLKKYHRGVVSYLLELPNDEGLKDLLEWFTTSWHTFPESVMLEILARVINNNEFFEKYLNQIGQHPVTNHQRFHEDLLKKVIELPESSIHRYKDMALILKIYPSSVLPKMFEVHLNERAEQTLWLIRLIEGISNTVLIDEEGKWL